MAKRSAAACLAMPPPGVSEMFCIRHDGTAYIEVSCDTPDSLIVATRDELVRMNPFYLDNESAMAIGGAILMVMAVAFVLRMARKSLDVKEETES